MQREHRSETQLRVASGTGTRHVADVQSEMDLRCSALDCDDRLTHSQGGGERTAFASRVSNVDRMTSLTNASVTKPSFCGCFGLPKLKNSDRSVIIDGDEQLLQSNSPLAMLHVDAGGLRRVHAAQGLSGPRRQEQEGWRPCHTVDDLVVCIAG